MIYKKELTSQNILDAMEKGEFGVDIIGSSSQVIVILTQDWCPQWRNLNSWIFSLPTDLDVDIYVLEYNKISNFKEFMGFKENVFKNYEVPYLRYYQYGKLIAETNYVNQKRVLEILEQ